MSRSEHLRKAPITEALIDIRATLPAHIKLRDLEKVCGELSDRYPNCRERRSFKGRLSFGEASPPALSVECEGPDGYLMTSKDGLQIVQARLDGFTFSRLRPYETWERLRDDAKSLWQTYCKAAHPGLVTRIAVRYVNRINLPLPVRDLKEWILTGPEVAPDLPQELAGYFFKIHLPFDGPRGYANVSQKVDVDEVKTHVALIFDIDAFLPIEADPLTEETWGRLEDLRTIKNRVFFDSLTEKTLELFRDDT